LHAFRHVVVLPYSADAELFYQRGGTGDILLLSKSRMSPSAPPALQPATISVGAHCS
jgi:hypothetical protein